MRLTRVHVPGPLFAGTLVLPEGPARHLVRVLRLDAGWPPAEQSCRQAAG